jgi:ATP-dependent Lon protease
LTQIDKKIGLAIGLAWTEVGGDVLEIEASVMPGKGTLTLTGQLGEVMQESAQAALSYVRARATLLGLTASFHTSKDIHIHIPEGATPKDGPSAGIAICSAMISALTKTTMQPYLAMTGEITLQGRVLAVGGLKEKLLAAQQHNITKVLVPKECVDDIKEIQTEVELDKLNIVFVDTMDEVLQHVFIISPLLLVRKKKKKKKIVKAPAL